MCNLFFFDPVDALVRSFPLDQGPATLPINKHNQITNTMNNEDLTVQQLYTAMAALCSRSEHCSSDIRDKIAAKGLDQETAEEFINQLIKEKFIDDERYIRSYVSDKFRFNRWGKVKIRHYLRMRKLSDHLIEEELSRIDTDKYREVLIKTLREKARSIKTKDPYQKMGQIIRFAQNRGFEPELIHRYLNDVIKKSNP